MTILLVFGFVYVGMVLGRMPLLALDRTGIALLGAIVLLATEQITPEDAWKAVDVPTIGLLFGLMVLSAQFRLGGFYTALTRHIATADISPGILLALVICVSGLLSALLANDIVCLAVAPLLVEACARRRLHSIPYLLALACASNIGSAATLIGNPQNMLIGQKLRLSFAGYLLDGGVPAFVGMIITWLVLRKQACQPAMVPRPVPDVRAPTFNVWQSAKGAIILLTLVICFLTLPVPREVLALAAAGLILTSRQMHSRQMLGLVDWQLLILFVSLFIVNHAFQTTSALPRTLNAMSQFGVDVHHPGWLFLVSVVLSNLVSNVPAVMLLLPAATYPLAGPILALSSTLAGNLFIAGSIANIIVVDQAGRLGIHISWREHARIGFPVALLTLILAGAWMFLRSMM